MDKEILLLGYAREGSTRVKDKMTRPFGNTTLFDLYMKKFHNIVGIDNPFKEITMAISPVDKKLWKKANTWDIPISERSEYSVKASISNDCRKVYHYLENFDEKYVMWINGCFPFLKEDTIIKAADYFIRHKKHYKGLHPVKEVYNWVWNPLSGLLFNQANAKKVSTVNFKPYYESVHCFHIYEREHLLENNCYWDFIFNNPHLYIVEDSKEFMDIDTQEDFDRCEYYYMKQK